MNLKELRDAYSNDDSLRALCDNMASRQRNQVETKLKRMLKLL